KTTPSQLGTCRLKRPVVVLRSTKSKWISTPCSDARSCAYSTRSVATNRKRRSGWESHAINSIFDCASTAWTRRPPRSTTGRASCLPCRRGSFADGDLLTIEENAMRGLLNKVAIVAGGAPGNIGGATAIRLAQEGMKVV